MDKLTEINEATDHVVRAIVALADTYDKLGQKTHANVCDILLKKIAEEIKINETIPLSNAETIDAIKGKFGLLSDIENLGLRVQRELPLRFQQYPNMEKVVQSILSLFEQLNTVVAQARASLGEMTG